MTDNWQTSWQFTSVLLLDNVSKPHDIFDDFESLLWVLLFVAEKHFDYQGNLSSQLFDEVHEDTHPLIGTISSGGDKKRAWLRQPSSSFNCQELEDLLTKYRLFTRKYISIASAADDDEDAMPELIDFRDRLEDHIRELFGYIDDILDDENASWENHRAKGAPARPKGPRSKQREIFLSMQKAAGNGLWRGSLGWKGKGVTPDKIHLIRDIIKKRLQLPELPRISTDFTPQVVPEDDEIPSLAQPSEPLTDTNSPPPLVQVRRHPARTIAQSDRVLRSRTAPSN